MTVLLNFGLNKGFNWHLENQFKTRGTGCKYEKGANTWVMILTLMDNRYLAKVILSKHINDMTQSNSGSVAAKHIKTNVKISWIIEWCANKAWLYTFHQCSEVILLIRHHLTAATVDYWVSDPNWPTVSLKPRWCSNEHSANFFIFWSVENSKYRQLFDVQFNDTIMLLWFDVLII